MSEQAGAKPKKHFKLYTTGGEPFAIPAHGMDIKPDENRIYFLDADDKRIEKWIVFLSNVAAIEITDPPTVSVGRLRR